MGRLRDGSGSLAFIDESCDACPRDLIYLHFLLAVGLPKHFLLLEVTPLRRKNYRTIRSAKCRAITPAPPADGRRRGTGPARCGPDRAASGGRLTMS